MEAREGTNWQSLNQAEEERGRRKERRPRGEELSLEPREKKRRVKGRDDCLDKWAQVAGALVGRYAVQDDGLCFEISNESPDEADCPPVIPPLMSSSSSRSSSYSAHFSSSSSSPSYPSYSSFSSFSPSQTTSSSFSSYSISSSSVSPSPPLFSPFSFLSSTQSRCLSSPSHSVSFTTFPSYPTSSLSSPSPSLPSPTSLPSSSLFSPPHPAVLSPENSTPIPVSLSPPIRSPIPSPSSSSVSLSPHTISPTPPKQHHPHSYLEWIPTDILSTILSLQSQRLSPTRPPPPSPPPPPSVLTMSLLPPSHPPVVVGEPLRKRATLAEWGLSKGVDILDLTPEEIEELKKERRREYARNYFKKLVETEEGRQKRRSYVVKYYQKEGNREKHNQRMRDYTKKKKLSREERAKGGGGIKKNNGRGNGERIGSGKEKRGGKTTEEQSQPLHQLQHQLQIVGENCVALSYSESSTSTITPTNNIACKEKDKHPSNEVNKNIGGEEQTQSQNRSTSASRKVCNMNHAQVNVAEWRQFGETQRIQRESVVGGVLLVEEEEESEEEGEGKESREKKER